MSQTSQGFVVSHTRGPNTQHPNEYILHFPNVKSISDASRLIGRKVAWPVAKRILRGKIVALHGKTGLVKARFRKGLPGQAIGTALEIIG